jgi:hypothetical protein
MRENAILSKGHLLILLATMLTVLLTWTTVAYAQTSNDAQYGSPTASGEAAIAEAGVSSAASSASASASASPGVLPSTGGPLVQLVALGAFAAASTGLLVLRLHGSR